MARAIKFTKDFGQVKTKVEGKTVVQGGFKKGEVWPNCSNQLAQKLVNHRKVAEFVEAKAGDNLRKGHGKAADVIKDAEKKAAEIVKEAELKADETIKAAQELADGKKKDDLT